MFPRQSSLDLRKQTICPVYLPVEEHCVSIHFKLLVCITSGVLGSLHKATKSFVVAGGCTGQIT